MSSPAADRASRARLALAELAERALALRLDPCPWIERNLWIRNKARQVIPFRLNAIQRFYNRYRTDRDVILKARQEGFTTFIEGLFFADCLLRPNTTSVLVAHDLDSTQKIFDIAKLFWERLPAREQQRVGRPTRDNRREFVWPNGSRFFVGTAGSGKFGHGLTIQNLHCSEVSRWPRPEEAMVGLLEAVPRDGRIIMESTANGVGNYFHDQYIATKEPGARFEAQFFVWFEHPEYTLAVTPEEAQSVLGSLDAAEQDLVTRYRLTAGQIAWRREKAHDLRDRFPEQYPEDDVNCFLASGACVFDRTALAAIAARIGKEEPARLIPLLAEPDGQALAVAPARLRVWRAPEPEGRYVVGADVGEGLPDGDASCAYVLARESRELVAELHGRVPPDRFGHLLDALGRWYHGALIAVEKNNHGHSTLNTLRNVCLYPRLYHHVRYDHRAGQPSTLGWPTDQATKPILVDDLAAAIADQAILIHSAELVDEAMTFINLPSGSQEAQEGKHDDRVMAAGIAWQARKRGEARYSTQRPEGM